MPHQNLQTGIKTKPHYDTIWLTKAGHSILCRVMWFIVYWHKTGISQIAKQPIAHKCMSSKSKTEHASLTKRGRILINKFMIVCSHALMVMARIACKLPPVSVLK